MSDKNSDKSLQEVDFKGLILGFSSAALYYMGEAPVDGKPAAQKNLALAQQNIEIINLLEEKTRGNLSPDEEELIRQILINLRMKFIEKTK